MHAIQPCEHACGAPCHMLHCVQEKQGGPGATAARRSAHAEAQRAIDAASQLPANEHRAGLLQLAAGLLERRS